jgi:6-phosphofructokinase 1
VSFSTLPPSQQLALDAEAAKSEIPHGINYSDPNSIAPLSDAPLGLGFGELLKDGAGEGDVEEMAGHAGIVIADQKDEIGKSLKGRYIVRVGWDDVRGWMGEGGTLIGSSRCPSCESTRLLKRQRWATNAGGRPG